MLDFVEISNKMRHYIKKLYNHNKNIYLSNSIDLKDLQQETLILSWKLVEENEKRDSTTKKDDIHLSKYIVKSIFYLINDIRRNSERATGIKREKQEESEPNSKICVNCDSINSDPLIKDEEWICSICGTSNDANELHENNKKIIKTGGYVNKIKSNTLTEDEILSFLSATPKSLLDEILFWEDIKSLCNDREYQILYKKFYEGKTIKEIAQELQISVVFVKKIYTKTLSKLKKLF